MKSVSESFAIVLHLAALLGLFPLYSSTKSFRKNVPLSFFMSALTLALFCYSCVGYFRAETAFRNNISKMLEILQNLLLTLATLAWSIGSSTWNFATIVELFKSFDRYDHVSASVFRTQLEGTSCLYLKFVVTYLTLLSVIAYNYCTYHYQDVGQFYFVGVCVQFGLTFLVSLIHVHLLTSVGRRLGGFSETVEGVVRGPSDVDLVNGVGAAMAMHSLACGMSERTNELFGKHTFLTVIVDLLGILNVISILIDTSRLDLSTIVALVLWIIFASLHAFTMAWKCQKIKNEGRNSVSILYREYCKPENSTVVREKLFFLAQQATLKQPEFTAAGFFNVDFSMLFTFVTLIATYVIVIFQFYTDTS